MNCRCSLRRRKAGNNSAATNATIPLDTAAPTGALSLQIAGDGKLNANEAAAAPVSGGGAEAGAAIAVMDGDATLRAAQVTADDAGA